MPWKMSLLSKKKHKNVFIKKNKVYAKEKISINARSFVNNFKKKNKKVMKEMGILSLSWGLADFFNYWLIFLILF